MGAKTTSITATTLKEIVPTINSAATTTWQTQPKTTINEPPKTRIKTVLNWQHKVYNW